MITITLIISLATSKTIADQIRKTEGVGCCRFDILILSPGIGQVKVSARRVGIWNDTRYPVTHYETRTICLALQVMNALISAKKRGTP